MLWNAAYWHDLNKSAGQKQRRAFISHQVDNSDESDHEFGEDNLNDSEEDDPYSYSVFQSSFNSTEPKKPTKVSIPYQLWQDFPEAAKQMIIDCNKKIKMPNPRPHLNGGNNQPKATLLQSNPKPQQVHLHENDPPPDNSPTETSTQTMVHECLSDGGMYPSDINNVMSAFKARAGKPPQETSRIINTHQRYVFARANQSTNYSVDRGANGGLAGAEMRILQKPTGRSILWALMIIN